MRALHKVCILLWIFPLSRGYETERLEPFVASIIGTWQLRSPTIIYNDDMPELCINHKWLLCITNDEGDNELTSHLKSIDTGRKQDGIIFVGIVGHEKLVKDLSKVVPTIMTSNYPVFMPLSYKNDIQLRLDSNILFYGKSDDGTYKLNDIFAVKGGPSISLEVGKWSFDHGFTLIKSMNRWDRRINLQNTTFVNCFANSPWTEFIRDANDNIVGSKGYLQDKLFYITDKLNLTMDVIEAEWAASLINGSWNGPLGFLQRKEADVASNGIGINLLRSNFIDYTIPIVRAPVTLIAVIPKGVSLNMWVYVDVFGVNQWMFIVLCLALIVVGLSVILTMSEDESGRELGTKRGPFQNHAQDGSDTSRLREQLNQCVRNGSGLNLKERKLLIGHYCFYVIHTKESKNSLLGKYKICNDRMCLH